MEHVVAENVENLVLEYLRRIDHKVDALADDVRDMKLRMSDLQLRVSAMQADIARIDGRLDRIDLRPDRPEIRVERSEKRPDLVGGA